MANRVPQLIAVLLVAVACATPVTQDTAADGGVASTAAESPTTVDQAESPSADVEAPTPAPTETDAPMVDMVTPPDGPPAPDFTLALGDGGSFTLSEEARPVYMVFWAEW